MRLKPSTWFIVILASVLSIGVGMSQMPQFHTGTAEARGEEFAQLTEKFNAIKAEHETLKATWQAELLAQFAPTLADESRAVKQQFLDFLEELGTPATAALIEMLNDSSERVREKAVEALGEIGEDARKAGQNTDAIASGLAAALSDPAERVRREALKELEDVRPTSPESFAVVVPALIARRTIGSSRERSDVLDVLGRIGEKLAEKGQPTATIRDALIASLTDNSSKVRTNAIEELSDMHDNSAETLAALRGVLTDSSKSVRRAAQKAIRRIEKASQ